MYTRGLYINIQVFRKSVRNTRLNTTIRKGTRQFICLHHRYLFDTWYETSACGLHAFFSVCDNAALKLNTNFFFSLCFSLCVWLSLCLAVSVCVCLSLSLSFSLFFFSLSLCFFSLRTITCVQSCSFMSIKCSIQFSLCFSLSLSLLHTHVSVLQRVYSVWDQ